MKVIYRQRGRDALYKVWHELSDNMIIYTYSEGTSLVFKDGIHRLPCGTLAFVGSAIQHYTMPDDIESYERSKIFLPEPIFEKILTLCGAKGRFASLFSGGFAEAFLPDEVKDEVDSLFLEADGCDTELCPEGFVSCFMRLMSIIEKYSTESESQPKDFLSLGVDFINKHYSEPITLDDICSAAHVSKFYFSHRFKEQMGVSVMEYLVLTRLAAAKFLLRTTDSSVTDISYECGFSSTSYFCQSFKKAERISPIEYRKTK